jgi:hypothetical protein
MGMGDETRFLRSINVVAVGYEIILYYHISICILTIFN